MLRKSFHYDPEWFKTFRQQLKNLREEVGSNLFMGEREKSRNIRQALPEESEAIYGILMKILKKWRPEIGEKKEDLEEAETVTLSFKDLKKETHSVREELEETVILSRKGLKEEPLSEKKELKKTVILSPEGLKKESSPEKVEKMQEILPETAIISLQGADKDALQSSPRSLSKEPGEKDKLEYREMNIKKTDEHDFLTETVIIKPEELEGKDKDGIKG